MAFGANPQVIVEYIAKVDGLRKGLADAEAATSSSGSKLKDFGKKALAVAGAAGLGALVYTLHAGVDELVNAGKVAAQTESVIRSTGGAAHVTARHVDDLATALMNKTGIDDEAIKSGENLLLTFTNIRNESGKNNKIFDQATRAVTDLSVALGQDMKTSAIQVGKALNNPIKGITALQRVGVTFTQAQKDQIKAMQDSGDMMGAQKVILAELNKEFGGSAEAAGKTLPGELNILKENFNNMAGDLVKVFVPALQAVTDLMVKNPGLFKALTIAILATAAAVVAMNIALTVTAVVASPITLIILGIVAAVAALIAIGYLLYKNWDTVVAGLSAVWKAISGVFTTAIDWIVGFVKDHWPLIIGALLGPFGLIVAEMIKHWDDIKRVVADGISGVIKWIQNAFDWIFQTGWNFGSQLVAGILAPIYGIGARVWDIVNNVGSWIGGQLSAVFQWGWNMGSQILAGVVSGVTGIAGAVWSIVGGIGSTIWGKLGEVWNWGWNIGRKIWDGIVGGLQGIAGWIMGAIKAPINAVIGAWNNLRIGALTIKLPHLPDIHFGGIDLPNLPYLQHGGIVTRPTLAMIGEAGPEAVVPLAGNSGAPVQVRVFIGETELRGMIRTEVVTENNRTAQTLLAGLAY